MSVSRGCFPDCNRNSWNSMSTQGIEPCTGASWCAGARTCGVCKTSGRRSRAKMRGRIQTQGKSTMRMTRHDHDHEHARNTHHDKDHDHDHQRPGTAQYQCESKFIVNLRLIGNAKRQWNMADLPLAPSYTIDRISHRVSSKSTQCDL